MQQNYSRSRNHNFHFWLLGGLLKIEPENNAQGMHHPILPTQAFKNNKELK